VRKPYLLYNENIAFFDRYAALYLSYLFAFLNDVTLGIFKDYNVSYGSDVTFHSPGNAVLESWIKNLSTTLETY
jgi:hypothetical protein